MCFIRWNLTSTVFHLPEGPKGKLKLKLYGSILLFFFQFSLTCYLKAECVWNMADAIQIRPQKVCLSLTNFTQIICFAERII